MYQRRNARTPSRLPLNAQDTTFYNPQARAFPRTVPSPHSEKPFAGWELVSRVHERLGRAPLVTPPARRG